MLRAKENRILKFFDFFAAVIAERTRYVTRKHDSNMYSIVLLCYARKSNMQHGTLNENRRRGTQIGAVCLGIGKFFLGRRQKKCRRQEKCLSFCLWLGELVLASCSAQRLIKYPSSDDDQVFLLPLELSLIFGDFFEGVMQATSAMFTKKHPLGYVKVGFCHRTEKSPVNRV